MIHPFKFLLRLITIFNAQTAGLTVAARLAEDPNVSVAVLEAGPAHFDDPLISSYTTPMCDVQG